MPRAASTSLAKLTRPRHHDALLRERLFALLDQARERRRGIGIIGPPGSGKTTLVATWLDDRAISGLWIQVDAGDADLASFFYYLGLAADGSDRSSKRPLPALTPEYLGDVPGFSRRYFRELFSRLPPGAVIVLDNYQEIAPDHPFHTLIAQAIEEVPVGGNLVVISRRDPPEAYARILANENVAIVEWDALKVTPEEAGRIASQRVRGSQVDVERLHALSGGWVAGLTLLLERASTASASPPDASAPPQRIFDYFATQVFAEADERHRQILHKLAFVPRMSATLANAIAGDSEAGRVLEYLYRRNLFTDRRGEQDGFYSFHALFRAFLLHGAQSSVGPDEIAAIQRESARLLEAEDFKEDAMDLYIASGEKDAAARLFVLEAPRLLASGRWKTVMEWFGALDAEQVESDPWVRYWCGAAQVAIAPAQARGQLALAHAAAVRRGEVMCQVQSAAAIIESCCIEWSRFSLMDPWIPVLQCAMDDTLPWPSTDARLRAVNALLSALAYRAPEHALLPLCVERTLALLALASDPNIKVVAASTLTNHGGHSGQPRIVSEGLASLGRWIDDAAVTMPNRAAGLFSVVWGRHVLRDVDAARTGLDALERLTAETGLTYAGTFSAFMGTVLEGAHGNLEGARQWFERLSSRVDAARWYDRAIYCCTAIWLSVYERDPRLALKHGDEGIELIADGVVNSAIQWRYPVAVAHARTGDSGAMSRVLTEIRQYVVQHRLHYWSPLCSACEAILAYRTHDEIALRAALTDMLRLSRTTEESYLWFLRADLPELLAVALEHEIHADEAQRLIRLYSLPSPAVGQEKWPWALRVFVLGGFSLEIDGTTVQFKGKTPKKPLALLKALICLGGQDVSIVRLCDLIWPEMDGDDAVRAFHTALYRLRALLRHENVVRLVDGRLSVDRSRVWIDSLVFLDLCEAARLGDDSSANRARSLYRGAMLDGETDAPWMIGAREELDLAHRLLIERATTTSVARNTAHPPRRSVNDR